MIERRLPRECCKGCLACSGDWACTAVIAECEQIHSCAVASGRDTGYATRGEGATEAVTDGCDIGKGEIELPAHRVSQVTRGDRGRKLHSAVHAWTSGPVDCYRRR